MRLHGVEGGLVDQRRRLDGDHFADRLQFLGFGALVELVATDVGRSGQDAVDLPDAPAAAVAGEDAALIEMAGDALDPQRAGRAIPFKGKAIDQSHRVGVQWVDFQLLLDLGPALLGRDDAIADGRQRAVPEALPGILLQGAEDVLGVLLGLVFVEERHDLPHHDVHGVVAHLLGDRHKLDAILRQLADVEFHFEMVAEESAERMDDDDIEQRGLARPRLDHPLELGPPVIRGRCARLDIGFRELVAARLTIRLALAFLVRDRDIMLGLPRRRDAQIEGGA